MTTPTDKLTAILTSANVRIDKLSFWGELAAFSLATPDIETAKALLEAGKWKVRVIEGKIYANAK